MNSRLGGLAGTAAAVAVTTLVLAATSTSARGSAATSTGCTPKFSGGVYHLCGPATAHFRGFTYTNGTCKRSDAGTEDEAFVLELGAIKPGSSTNGGLPYLKIEVFGPLAHPTSGHLISWHGGKRWAGYGESFKTKYTGGKFVGGTFVVTRTATGAERETGSFHC
jgi:hypothetical protein